MWNWNGRMSEERMSDRFPPYTRFDPAVPVWCVTPKSDRSIHRFFDSSPFSPSGRYLVATRLPFEDRLPRPGDVAEILLCDLASGEERCVAATRGWDMQLGAQAQWGSSDRQLLFNDVDPTTWTPFGVSLDPVSGHTRKLHGTIYAVSPDGRYGLSPCLKRIRLIQPGYGVIVPPRFFPAPSQPADDDGIFITDLATGHQRLLVSIREILDMAGGPARIAADRSGDYFGFHVKWNPQGDRILFVLRWKETRGRLSKALSFMGRQASRAVAKAARTLHVERLRRAATWLPRVRNQVIVLRHDGTQPRVIVPADLWAKGGHHPNWCPDGRSLIMNLNVDGWLRFVRFVLEDGAWEVLSDRMLGSGHPSMHPNGRHIVTDAYPDEPVAFGDGTVPIRLVDCRAGKEQTLVRISTRPVYRGPRRELRVDPHPAWDRVFRRVAFNASPDGTRRVYVADLAGHVA
jgi:hypothetical protein